jgi:uncharacterized protein (DUF302 family)
MASAKLGMSRRVPDLGFEEVVARTREALKAEGFGVLTEIDVRATLKAKIDVDFRPYQILGACNPGLAHAVLEINPEFGLLMPCNVVVEAEDDGVRVSMADPAAMARMANAPDAILPIVAEAREGLERALDAI